MKIARLPEIELGDVIDIFDSKRVPLSSKERSKRQGKYPYYGASGIIDQIDDYIFDGEYLLIAEDGENLNSRKLPIAFWGRGKFWVNNHAHIILGKKGKASTDFIRLWFAQANISGYITGAAQPKLSQSNLKRIKLNLPLIDEQEKIAEVLSAYDKLIENNNCRIAILEEMAQSLYREWFVKFRFPGHENTKFIDSSLGKIPEGWEVRLLGELVNFKRDSVQKGNLPEPTAYMGLEHFPRKSISLSEWDVVAEIGSSKLKFKRGDILFGKIRPYFHKVGVAQVDGICSSDTFVLEAINTENHALIAMVTFSDEFVAHSVQTSQGTKMPRANWDVLSSYLVLVPNNQIRDKFNKVVDTALDQIMVLSKKNRNLKVQRDLLLPKLISGTIAFNN